MLGFRSSESDQGSPGTQHLRAIAAGNSTTCVLDDEGVKCWGSNASGEITVPAGIKNPSEVTAHGFNTCVLDDDGVKCWGNNSYGQTVMPVDLFPTTEMKP